MVGPSPGLGKALSAGGSFLLAPVEPSAMTDRRALSGTKTLQTAWTVLALVGLLAAVAWRPELLDATSLAAGGAVWLAGLLAMGWRERRAWNRLVARSTFERQAPGSMADLQRIVKGHTVTVATDVPGLLSQTHTVVAATVDGVDAAVDIEFDHVGEAGADGGLETGNPALDEAWVVHGDPSNVELLLSADVQAALMDLTVPATVHVTADRVRLRVPFTRLTPEELAAAAEAVATVAERLERLGRNGSAA